MSYHIGNVTGNAGSTAGQCMNSKHLERAGIPQETCLQIETRVDSCITGKIAFVHAVSLHALRRRGRIQFIRKHMTSCSHFGPCRNLQFASCCCHPCRFLPWSQFTSLITAARGAHAARLFQYDRTALPACIGYPSTPSSAASAIKLAVRWIRILCCALSTQFRNAAPA